MLGLMLLRTLRPQFVVTFSTLGVVSVSTACKTPPAEILAAPSAASPTAMPSATEASGPAPSVHPSPQRIDYPSYTQRLNGRDGKQNLIYRTATGCVVEVPDDAPMKSWRPPKTEAVTCPASMLQPVWNLCTRGTLSAKADHSECLCSHDGNPPPPPTLMDCPK